MKSLEVVEALCILSLLTKSRGVSQIHASQNYINQECHKELAC